MYGSYEIQNYCTFAELTSHPICQIFECQTINSNVERDVAESEAANKLNSVCTHEQWFHRYDRRITIDGLYFA